MGMYTRLHIGPKTINLLKDMYFHTRKKVEVNNELTDWLNSEIGVRQGCVLSHILFAMYIQQFGVILEESKLGVNCDNLIIPGFFFADDMVLITESRADLEKQLSF